MTSMMEQLEKDEQQRKQDALDAARYRVLRDPLCNHGVLPTGRKLDDYCDAAISAEKQDAAPPLQK